MALVAANLSRDQALQQEVGQHAGAAEVRLDRVHTLASVSGMHDRQCPLKHLSHAASSVTVACCEYVPLFVACRCCADLFCRRPRRVLLSLGMRRTSLITRSSHTSSSSAGSSTASSRAAPTPLRPPPPTPRAGNTAGHPSSSSKARSRSSSSPSTRLGS